MNTTKTNIISKTFGWLFVLVLFINYSCSSNDNDDNHFTYIGVIDQWCEYLILIEKNKKDVNDGYEFVKPINLDNSFKIHELKVKVTFDYKGEQQRDCGGFVGNPEKIEIVKIEKL